MDDRQKKILTELSRGGVRFHYPMCRLTTYQVGGPAEALWKAGDLANLKEMVRFLFREGIPYAVVGRGSNLLAPDEGVDGVVIVLSGALAQINGDPENLAVWAGGGGHLSELMNWCRPRGMSGLEFLTGIPGTVGGAVAMNSGAFGREIQENILEVEWVTREGQQVVMNRSKLEFSYRHFHLEEGAIITSARFGVTCSSPDAVSEKMLEFLTTRKKTQPLEYPSAGSVFKNPPGEYAGRLIEKAGLKGKRIGGAEVSEKHANYIINNGNATANDILSLMDLVRRKVLQQSGINLEPEIRVLGKKTSSFFDETPKANGRH